MQPYSSKVTSDIFTLASLTDTLPIIKTPKGEFVPLRALCEIVGLRPSTYIGVYCARYQGHSALKRLPWQSPGGLQDAWCIARDYLPYWLMEVPTNRLPKDRQERVLALQRQCLEVWRQWFAQSPQDVQMLRALIFMLLTFCDDLNKYARRFGHWGLELPTASQRKEARTRLAWGQERIDAMAEEARKALAQMLNEPTIDGHMRSEDKEADMYSLPPFPIVLPSYSVIKETIEQLCNWRTEMLDWFETQLS